MKRSLLSSFYEMNIIMIAKFDKDTMKVRSTAFKNTDAINLNTILVNNNSILKRRVDIPHMLCIPQKVGIFSKAKDTCHHGQLGRGVASRLPRSRVSRTEGAVWAPMAIGSRHGGKHPPGSWGPHHR